KHAFRIVGRHGAQRNDEIIFAQIDATSAARRATHWPRVLFIEANGETVVRGDKDALRAVGQDHVEQRVAFIDVDGDDPVRANVLKICQRGLLDYAFARHQQNVTALRE